MHIHEGAWAEENSAYDWGIVDRVPALVDWSQGSASSFHPACSAFSSCRTQIYSYIQFLRRNYQCKACVHAKSLQSSPTLCDPMDWSPPGSSVHGILQARMLEWVVMPSSGNLPKSGIVCTLRSPAAGSLPLALPGKPCQWYRVVHLPFLCPEFLCSLKITDDWDLFKGKHCSKA